MTAKEWMEKINYYTSWIAYVPKSKKHVVVAVSEFYTTRKRFTTEEAFMLWAKEKFGNQSWVVAK